MTTQTLKALRAEARNLGIHHYRDMDRDTLTQKIEAVKANREAQAQREAKLESNANVPRPVVRIRSSLRRITTSTGSFATPRTTSAPSRLPPSASRKTSPATRPQLDLDCQRSGRTGGDQPRAPRSLTSFGS